MRLRLPLLLAVLKLHLVQVLEPMHSDTQSTRLTVERATAFTTTHWSVVLRAGHGDLPQAAEALDFLCQSYWYPLYAYIRRNGHSPHDAQDLTQEFFARLLERNYLQLADESRGRFRTFLLTSLKRFLINDWRKVHRDKRGGGRKPISLDAEDTEARFQVEPVDNRTPDKAFDRQWSVLVLSRVLDRLEAELLAEKKGPLFNELKTFLLSGDGDGTYAEIAGRLGMTVGNLKVTVHRLRRRYRELLRHEISMTVEAPEVIDKEIQELISALGT